MCIRSAHAHIHTHTHRAHGQIRISDVRFLSISTSHAYTWPRMISHDSSLISVFFRRVMCRKRRFISHMCTCIRTSVRAHLSTAFVLLTIACEELASAWRGAKSIVTARSIIIIVVMKSRMERVPRCASAAARLPCCTCMAFSPRPTQYFLFAPFSQSQAHRHTRA